MLFGCIIQQNEGPQREVGSEAVWTLSTAKPGNGIEQLRDNNCKLYYHPSCLVPIICHC
jgi:hypothetical protein